MKWSSSADNAMFASSGDRIPPCGVPVCVASRVPVVGHHPGLEERLDQPQHALVLDPYPDPVHQRDVIDVVETRLDVGLQHPVIPVGGEVMDLGDGVVRAPVRVGTRTSTAGSPPRRSVPAPVSALPGPPGRSRSGSPAARSFPLALGDHHLPHLDRPERAAPSSRSRTCCQELLDPDPGRDLGHRGPVHPRRPRPRVPGDALPRHHQERRVADEVVQIIEPAAEDPRPPNGAAWPASSVPSTCARRSSGQATAPVFTGASSDITVPPCSSRCRPSPCGRLSRPRSTTAAPPHPRPSAGDAPIPAEPWRDDTERTRMVPTFTVVRSTGEAPGFAPAASPWLRRRRFTTTCQARHMQPSRQFPTPESPG